MPISYPLSTPTYSNHEFFPPCPRIYLLYGVQRMAGRYSVVILAAQNTIHALGNFMQKNKQKKPSFQRGKPAPKQQGGKNNNRAQKPMAHTGPIKRHQEQEPTLAPKHHNSFFLFGRHAVEAALKNPSRECIRLIGLEKALPSEVRAIRPKLRTETVSDETVLRSAVPSDSPHQGILLEVRPLPSINIEDLAPQPGQPQVLLMLDQVTDPHNVGACLRSAAALGAAALITQDRHSPGESGVLARSAAGALETLPWMRAANLSQTLDSLKDMGYWHVGLAGNTETNLGEVSLGDHIVIVMGSEGKGLRPLVQKHCDVIAKIPMTDKVESLNVSNAAAIALYALAGKAK